MEGRRYSVDEIRSMTVAEYAAVRHRLYAVDPVPVPIVTCEDCDLDVLAEESVTDPLWAYTRCSYCYELAVLRARQQPPKRRRLWRLTK